MSLHSKSSYATSIDSAAPCWNTISSKRGKIVRGYTRVLEEGIDLEDRVFQLIHRKRKRTDSYTKEMHTTPTTCK